MSTTAAPQPTRQSQTNTSITTLCQLPKPPQTTPHAHGIGLYTHVAVPSLSPRNPHASLSNQSILEVAFFPLGGPKRIKPSLTRAPPDPQLAALYRELSDAVGREEGGCRVGIGVLRERYGGVGDVLREVGVEGRSGLGEKRRHSEVGAEGVVKKKKSTATQV